MKKNRGNGTVRISDLFLKYQKTLKAPQGSIIATCITVIQEVLGITLTKDQCTYNIHTKTLTIHTSGILKSEITLKKSLILKHIAMYLGQKSAPKEIL
jgi:hypothetical protein